jgi:hypothetical protein
MTLANLAWMSGRNNMHVLLGVDPGYGFMNRIHKTFGISNTVPYLNLQRGWGGGGYQRIKTMYSLVLALIT